MHRKKFGISFINRLRYSLKNKGKSNFNIFLVTFFTPIVIGALIIYFGSLVPVKLTQYFAKQSFMQTRTITEISCNNASGQVSANTHILFSHPLSIGQKGINFDTNLCKEIPNFDILVGKNITLKGRSSILGTYIDGFYYAMIPLGEYGLLTHPPQEETKYYATH